jgi:hypothetical protein
VFARIGLIDRSNLGSIDFGVVGPKPELRSVFVIQQCRTQWQVRPLGNAAVHASGWASAKGLSVYPRVSTVSEPTSAAGSSLESVNFVGAINLVCGRRSADMVFRVRHRRLLTRSAVQPYRVMGRAALQTENAAIAEEAYSDGNHLSPPLFAGRRARLASSYEPRIKAS